MREQWFPPPTQRLEYYKIDAGQKASLNKMHKEMPLTADMAIKRMQDTTAVPKIVGQVVFSETGETDVLIFKADQPL